MLSKPHLAQAGYSHYFQELTGASRHRYSSCIKRRVTTMNLRLARISKAQFLLLVFMAAFLVRAAAVVGLRDPSIPPGKVFTDGMDYNTLGINVAAGRGYMLHHPTSFRAPGFPLVLAALYKAAGVHYPLSYALLCGMGALACVLIYLIGCLIM